MESTIEYKKETMRENTLTENTLTENTLIENPFIDDEPYTTENKEMEDITMELLMNKSQYNKYVHQLNPAKFKEREMFLNQIRGHRESISSMMQELLYHPEEIITREINDSFHAFVKVCLKHLEIREIHESHQGNNYKKNHAEDDMDEEETMFGNIDQSLTNSVWGEKIVKQKYSYLDGNL